jgi:beta-lactamase regulating signal transducer with metallopeptidase domain
MNLSDFLSSSLIEALGWTLVHSLWQGLLITGIVVLSLKIVPSKLSGYRYGIALTGLLCIILATAVTFTKLYVYTADAPIVAPYTFSFTSFQNSVSESPDSFIGTTLYFMEANMKWFVAAWIAGALFFMMRVVGGSIYVSVLRKESLPLHTDWNVRLQEMARALNIRYTIALSESARVHAPVVLGYIKPLIILPTGMLTGLTTEQLETIFLHELIHIKRHDYIVNLIQMFIEALLFFNPFVWMISSIIRDEREHCCDDAVVTRTGNVRAYTSALVQLEEARLNQAGVALSLAENKTQLLNRIKRLMEKSVKNYSGRDRVIPIALVAIGLVCASWITMTRAYRDETTQDALNEKIAQADTTIKNKNKTARYSKKTITTVDENGEPHEEVEEIFEGDEELRPVVEPVDVTLTVPAVPDFPDFPDFPAFAAFPDPVVAPFDFTFHMDSIPVPVVTWGDNNWDEFAKEFENSFKENFGDFYKSHEKDFEKMMKDIKVKYEFENEAEFRAEAERMQHEMEKSVIESQQALLEQQQAHVAKQHALREMDQALAMQEKNMKRWNEDMQRWEEVHAKQMKELEANMKVLEKNMKQFEEELQQQLIKDGYLKKGDKIKNLNWNDDGTIEINGKEIKPADKEKYQKLHKKYFKEDGNIHYVK